MATGIKYPSFSFFNEAAPFSVDDAAERCRDSPSTTLGSTPVVCLKRAVIKIEKKFWIEQKTYNITIIIKYGKKSPTTTTGHNFSFGKTLLPVCVCELHVRSFELGTVFNFFLYFLSSLTVKSSPQPTPPDAPPRPLFQLGEVTNDPTPLHFTFFSDQCSMKKSTLSNIFL